MATTSNVTSPDFEEETPISPTTVEESTVPTQSLASDDATSEEDPSEDPSDEEPMEAESTEEEPMEEEPSEDLSPRTVTPTSPIQTTRIPTYDPYFPEGRRILRTARMSVRTPRNNPYPIPITTASTGNTTTETPSTRARSQTGTRQWDWLPNALAAWRAEEGIQTPTEDGESSAVRNLPYTQEPIHHTVPVLAARLRRHEIRLEDMEIEQQATSLDWMRLAQGRIAQVYQNQEDLVESMDLTRDQVDDTRDEVTALLQRLEQCELRSQEAEEYSSMLEQRLTIAEESARQAGRLAETLDQVIALLPRLNHRQN